MEKKYISKGENCLESQFGGIDAIDRAMTSPW